MNSRAFLLTVSITVFLLVAMAASSFAASVPRMSTDELNSRLAEADLVILDVRSPYHWGPAETKIKGADRVSPGGVAEWANNYSKEQTIVLYCAWPTEGTSASVAWQLMNRGYQKVFALKGGWNEWQSKNLPVEPK